MADNAEPAAKCTFIKKKRRGQVKKRKARSDTDSDESSDNNSAVVKKTRKRVGGISAGIKKEIRTTKDIKKSTLEDFGVHSIQSDRSAVASGPQDQGATSTVQIDAIIKEDPNAKPAVSKFIKPGPTMGAANIRTTIRWDYAPDICKDYKETGYCGFGDTCKFMHDRGDYKMGWQLDKEYDAGTYGKKNYEEEESSDEDEIPFACFICRKPFTDPVVTSCKHYFCCNCALGHYKKNTKCFVCNAPTGGLFNAAKEIIQRQEKQAEMARNEL